MVSLFLRGCAGALLSVALATVSLAATGDWDYSYGTNGRIELTVPAGTFRIHNWRQQADGKIVAAGTVMVGSAQPEGVVVRFQENGTLDPSFDGDGMLPWPDASVHEIGLELQPDGRLLVAASRVIFGGGAYHAFFRMRRLNSDGSLDATFANGGDFSYPSDAFNYRPLIGLTPQGGIVLVAVSTNSDGQSGRVTRLTPAGAFDASFGTNGTVQFDVQNYFGVADFVVHPNGSLTIGGSVGPFGSDVPYVARVTADGRFDTAFGEGGVLVPPFFSGVGYVTDIVSAPDGKVYVAGFRDESDDVASYTFIARVGTNGLLDPTFGSGGRIITAGTVTSLTLEADGKLLAAGSINELQATGLGWVARYNVDGSPDVTFGLRGANRLDFSVGTAPIAGYLYDVIRHPDGSYRALASNGVWYSMVRLIGSGTSAGVIGLGGTNTFEQGYRLTETTAFMPRFNVFRTGGADGVVSAQYRLVGGSATAGEDFVAATGTVTFNDGEIGLKQVPMELLDDDIQETEETFHVELFGAGGGAEISRTRLNFGIGANDGEYGTRAAFVTTSLAVTEGSPNARLIVRRTGSISRPLSVTYTATSSPMIGVDFNGPTGTIDWAANEGGTRIIEFPLIDDALAESDELFSVTLTSTTAGAIPAVEGRTATVVIVDNDTVSGTPALNFSSSSVRVSETATSVALTVERMGDPASALTASWTTNTSGSTATAGQDYVADSDTLSWGAGDASPKTIVIALLNDSLAEALESLNVTITGDAPATTPHRSVLVYIDDDEAGPAPPVISIAPGTSVNESAGTATATLTIAGVPQTTVSVSVGGTTGTANGYDFGSVSNTVSWTAGDTSPKTVTFPIFDDTRDEIDETFYVYLSSPTNGALLGTARLANYTIVDDDATPPGEPAPVADGVRAPVSAITVGENQGSVRFQMERVGDPRAVMTLQYFVASGGSATAPGDYYSGSGFVQWAANDVAPKEFELLLNGDSVAEPTETFTIRFSMLGGASLAEVTFTIIDDDSGTPARVGFVSANHSATESATTVTLQVSRTGNTTIASSVDYVTANGTASGSDFTAATGTLTWAENDTSTKLITLTLNPDTTDEADEAFTVSLRNASAGTEFDTATATVTIADDDVEVASSSGGKGGGGGEESLIGLLLWGARASLRARSQNSRRRCFGRSGGR